MFEEIVNYIEKGIDNFSPSIFYSAFNLYFDPAAKYTVGEILKKQNVDRYEQVNIDVLTWREVLAMFSYTYILTSNFAMPNECNKKGIFLKLAKRLKETDVDSPKGKFDDRKYYLLKNYVYAACKQSEISCRRVILKKPRTLWFLSGRFLDEVRVELSFLDDKDVFIYLEALQKNKHIQIYEPSNCEDRLVILLLPQKKAE